MTHELLKADFQPPWVWANLLAGWPGHLNMILYQRTVSKVYQKCINSIGEYKIQGPYQEIANPAAGAQRHGSAQEVGL